MLHTGRPTEEPEESKGFVTFSLTNGPEYHVSQITDAVVVARYLKATLVIPDIRGSQLGDWRNFGDIYDIEKFVSSLDGVVKVVKSQPSELSTKDLAVLRIPNRVTEEYIANNIEPVFKTKGHVRLATYFPSVNMKRTCTPENEERNSVGCLAMFGSLELQPEVREVVDSIVERLQTLSRKSDSEFVAVDLRLDMLDQKGCQGSKKCYGPDEIALFLKKLVFDKNSAVYLTQSRWDNSLDSLKDIFPKTYTKELIMPMDKKQKFLGSDSSEYEKVIDFYVRSESDVFVPAISGLFYANVAGKRIGSGKTKIVVPDDSVSAGSELGSYISRYVSKKTHMAYSGFC
ncbi:putative GDP-fucose protein O-fucosyltransferase [Helianthus annuus]|nr:putative GDP-fucose protein O-fucosyltransferase [Helianthus annuus]